MPKSPTAIELPVKELFSSGYLFNIPGYQRPYAWTGQQARELLDDLLAFLETNPEPEVEDEDGEKEAPTYFLGSIVLIKEKDKPDATVVDGQQRLTTLTLLLSAIRSQVSLAAADALSDYIFEKGNKISRLPDRFRLRLRELDAEFFKQYVQEREGFPKLLALNSGAPIIDTDAKRLLRSNAMLFAERLKSLPPDQLEALAMCIANRCYVVAVSTADFGSAFRIFSVLNSRGLDLGPTDILKAKLLEKVAEQSGKREKEITQAWEAMEVELGRDGFFELFTHIRAIYRKTKAKGSLLEELTEELKPLKVTEFFDKMLLPARTAFAGIRDADYQHAEFGARVNEHLTWLNRLDFKDWVPPAISFWMRHAQDGPAMLAFYADLERLTYSMLVRRESDNTRISRFGELTRAIEDGINLTEPSSKLQLSPFEQAFTYRALDGAFYLEIRSATARKNVLLRLDSLLATGEAHYDHPIISVEHVLPQTPEAGGEWMSWFPQEADRALWTHRLGNLVLLAKSVNSSARNYAFSRKKSSYFVRRGVTTFALTTPVIAMDKWTPDTVAKRHAHLVSVLEKHWRLENRKDDPAARLLAELS